MNARLKNERETIATWLKSQPAGSISPAAYKALVRSIWRLDNVINNLGDAK